LGSAAAFRQIPCLMLREKKRPSGGGNGGTGSRGIDQGAGAYEKKKGRTSQGKINQKLRGKGERKKLKRRRVRKQKRGFIVSWKKEKIEAAAKLVSSFLNGEG